MRYTLRQIEYFIATAETGSITLASERMNISQPSISTAIAHLEQELDTQLFVRRHAQGLFLTTAGKTLLVEAKRLIEYAQQIYEVASEVNEKVRGQVSLGCMVTLAPMIMPELSHSFTASFPATRVIQVVGDHDTLLQKLASAEIDVALTYDLLVPDGFNFMPLANLPLHVLVGEIHPFSRRSSVTVQDIAPEPLLLLDLPVSREYFLSIFMQAGLDPTIGARSPHQDILRTMAANGYGYTLANVRPRSDTAMDGRKVVRVRLATEHKPMTIGLVSLKERRKSRLIELFEQHCQNRVSDTYIPGMVAPVTEQ